MEGVLPHEMKMLLQHCTINVFFQISTVTQILLAFDFGYSELADKPALFAEDSLKIKQSA